MIDKEQYLPSREDLHKLVKAFCSVHVENELDLSLIHISEPTRP